MKPKYVTSSEAMDLASYFCLVFRSWLNEEAQTEALHRNGPGDGEVQIDVIDVCKAGDKLLSRLRDIFTNKSLAESADYITRSRCLCDSSARSVAAIEVAVRFGGTDGTHHKSWVIDQMVRKLAGPDYDRIVAMACAGEEGPNTHEWDVGMPP